MIQKRGYLITCLSWFLVDCAFELGQKFNTWFSRIIPDWLIRIPFLENSKNYFLRGSFDFFDVAAITIGAIVAFRFVSNNGKKVIMMTKKVNGKLDILRYLSLLCVIVLGMISIIATNDGGGNGGGNRGNGYGLPSPTKTGIEPLVGSCTFNQQGCFSVVQDSNTGEKLVRFDSDCFNFAMIQVLDGAFFHEWGQIGGTNCPTDGYGISGQFGSENRADGTIKYAYACRIMGCTW